jgi:hypothetical protein
MPTDQLPDFLRGLTGGTLTILQVETWDPPDGDGGREGTIEVEISGAPVRMSGTPSMVPDGTGDGIETVETIDGDLKARVPLIGGRVERAAEPAVRAAVGAERRTGTAWLAGER